MPLLLVRSQTDKQQEKRYPQFTSHSFANGFVGTVVSGQFLRTHGPTVHRMYHDEVL